jgi:hypothetical protein
MLYEIVLPAVVAGSAAVIATATVFSLAALAVAADSEGATADSSALTVVGLPTGLAWSFRFLTQATRSFFSHSLLKMLAQRWPPCWSAGCLLTGHAHAEVYVH